jgi:hypothetical protein
LRDGAAVVDDQGTVESVYVVEASAVPQAPFTAGKGDGIAAGAFALERLQERCLLATDVGAMAAVQAGCRAKSLPDSLGPM